MADNTLLSGIEGFVRGLSKGMEQRQRQEFEREQLELKRKQIELSNEAADVKSELGLELMEAKIGKMKADIEANDARLNLQKEKLGLSREESGRKGKETKAKIAEQIRKLNEDIAGFNRTARRARLSNDIPRALDAEARAKELKNQIENLKSGQPARGSVRKTIRDTVGRFSQIQDSKNLESIVKSLEAGGLNRAERDFLKEEYRIRLQELNK